MVGLTKWRSEKRDKTLGAESSIIAIINIRKDGRIATDMSFQNPNFQHFEPNSKSTLKTLSIEEIGCLFIYFILDSERLHPDYNTVTHPATASQVTVVHDPRRETNSTNLHSEVPSRSAQPSAIHYAPTPPSVASEAETYGPERVFGHLRNPITQNANQPVTPSPASPFDGQQLPMAAFLQQDNTLSRDFKDELAIAAEKSVTPGVPDVPYIQYALDALTRRRDDSWGYPKHDSSESDESYPRIHHLVPNATPALFQPHVSRPPPEQPHVPEPSPVMLRPDRAQRPTTSAVPQQYTPDFAPSSQPEWQERPAPSPGVLPFAYQPSSNLPNIRNRPEPTFFPERHTDQNSPRPQSAASIIHFPRDAEHWEAESNSLLALGDPEKARDTPPLTFKPWILQDRSLLFLMMLCLLMIVALIFCAVYSIGRNGFMEYGGTMYGSDYFLFRVLPQLLGAVLLFYAQGVIAASFRVLPFSLMASDDVRERRDAGFLPLYPKSFLWPQLVGPWNVWIPMLNVWLLNFTIPLLCSLFTVKLVDGTWIWATVQGVVWTLVALYVSLLSALVIVFVYWHSRQTGMLAGWDLRTLADIIYISAQSNSLSQYRGTEMYSSRQQMKSWLRDNVEKLGFWSSTEAPELSRWYSIGVPSHEEKVAFQSTGGQMWDRLREASAGSSARRLESDSIDARYQYLPWCFRSGQISLFVVTALILLIALIAVSFNHATDVRYGFVPGLSAAPTPGVFSAANFLYSFLPSLIGMILFLAFQSLDLTLRILTPWGELSRSEGSRAEKSLLVDYAACMPWGATFKAVGNKHWRVAFISFLAPLFLLLPILGGGLFMALTPPSRVVRMYPNVAAFAVVLVLLVLYLLSLISLVPRRDQFRLPHAVTCLAEIISFCCSEELCTDPAFNYPRGPEELRVRLDVASASQGRWAFGCGRANNERLGVKRFSKYTVSPRSVRSKYDRQVRGDGQQQQHLLPDNGSSFFRRDNDNNSEAF